MTGRWPMWRWLAAAVLLVAALSFCSLVVLSLAAHTAGLLPHRQESMFALRERLAAQRHSWEDPAWQVAVSADLAAEGVEAELLDARGRTVFRSAAPAPATDAVWLQPGGARRFSSRVEQRVEVREQGAASGYVRFWLPWSPFADGGLTNGDGWAAMLLIFLLAVCISSAAAVWLLTRLFLSPLRSLIGAAEQVSRGELEFVLPQARVREVDGVLQAFGRMAEGLRESVVRQAALEEERRFFLAAISHDLRTPLFSLRGRLEGLRDGLAQRPEQVQHYLSTALVRVGQMQRLVDGLFAYTRLSLLEQSIARDPLELGATLREAAAGLGPQAEARQVALLLRPPDSPCPLQGDGYHLGRAVENLLQNAIRYTPRGGAVTLAWERVGPEALIRVEDTGPGLPPEVLADPGRLPVRDGAARRPGEPGSGARAHPSSGGGAGLGLHIARRAAEAHGGTLTAANRPGGGACLTIRLPVNLTPTEVSA